MRAGSWQIRFDDRFDAAHGLRESATARPPWPDELAAAEGIGAMRQGRRWRWTAELEGLARHAEMARGESPAANDADRLWLAIGRLRMGRAAEGLATFEELLNIFLTKP